MKAKDLTAQDMGRTITVRQDDEEYTGELTRLEFEIRTFGGGLRVAMTVSRKHAHAFLHVDGEADITPASIAVVMA